MDIERAPAKINLALHVRERMADGYHRIETIFAFAADGDVLTARAADELSLAITGPSAAELSTGPDNLVLRAALALRRQAGGTTGAALVLTKNLPLASGIGGGSADAAATLRLLSRLWATQIDLMPIAAELGADVPACLLGRTVRGEKRGDQLTPVPDQGLSGRPLLLLNPGVPMPTGPVFAGWDGVDCGALGQGDALAAARAGRNDLEAPAIRIAPVIGDVVAWLQQQPGAMLARMSGSGATCFAIFDTHDALMRADGAAAVDWPDAWRMATHLA